MHLTADAASRSRGRGGRARFTSGRKAEQFYAEKLRGIARHIGAIIRAFPVGSPESVDAIREAMSRYAEVLKPWARATGQRMLEDVARRDKSDWAALAKEMSRALQREILDTPTGELFQQILDRQVTLISSLPLEAARRVHQLTLRGLIDGSRAGEVARDILRTSDVTVARANLIARTETARTASSLTQARAAHVGSTAYIWRTAGDGSVRPSHKAMNGQVVLWAAAPTLDGMTGHAGEFPNCRCYPEVIIPD